MSHSYSWFNMLLNFYVSWQLCEQVWEAKELAVYCKKILKVSLFQNTQDIYFLSLPEHWDKIWASNSLHLHLCWIKFFPLRGKVHLSLNLSQHLTTDYHAKVCNVNAPERGAPWNPLNPWIRDCRRKSIHFIYGIYWWETCIGHALSCVADSFLVSEYP